MACGLHNSLYKTKLREATKRWPRQLGPRLKGRRVLRMVLDDERQPHINVQKIGGSAQYLPLPGVLQLSGYSFVS